ncbi:NAD(P)-binding protein [Streptomyces sp. SID13666]|uniref:FAD-dependent monooxygenase n=1 Tax=unclassified Streptomyces TaxID=2593676 RepID=UPI0013BF1565|nr:MULTISPECIES: FAD-dependent monooxygenase [unclassified Streptomyces]NEA55112.1 NAD(P)-binding protein [Streptomyces sp. SID13666]NEA71119.1 NAD(P)-binding protein [Streptomyces sp. SID13588]
MATIRKALVIGAGIGGLTTAAGLLRQGIEAQVFEARPTPGRLLTGGGFMLWHNAVLSLRRIGLDEAVVADSVRMRFHEFRSDSGRRLARWHLDGPTAQAGAPACALRRSHLHTVLTEAVGNHRIRLGSRLTGYTQDADGVSARFEDGSTVRGDVLIGADGLRSTVRAAMRGGFEPPPRYAGYTAWQAITRLPGESLVPTGTFFNLWGKGGLRFLYCRLNEDEVYWDAITSDRATAGIDTMHNSRGAALATAYRDWPEPIGRIIASTDEEAILPVSIHDRPPGGGWSKGRVVVIGDAAHPMTLNLSQGAGQAIESGVVLADMLGRAEPDAVPETLRAFEHARRARAADMVTTSWRIGTLGLAHSAPLCRVRDVMMYAFFDKVAKGQSYSLMLDGRLERAPLRTAAVPGHGAG